MSSPYAGTVDQKSVETQLKAQAAAACVRAWFCSGGPTVTRVWTTLYAVLEWFQLVPKLNPFIAEHKSSFCVNPCYQGVDTTLRSAGVVSTDS